MNSVWNPARARRIMDVLGAILGVLLFSASLSSQGNYGRILGAVSDQSGGLIPGAAITLIDKDRGVARTLTTDAAGEYNAPQLLPGTYTVRVEANGFKKLERENIAVGVGKDVRVDLTVQPGTQEQTVTVNEAVPLVETTNASLGGTLQNTDINDLPLNGRNYQSLLGLRPGVMTQKGGSPWTQSTNNVRPDESTWMLDGLLSVNAYDSRPIAGAAGFFTDSTTILPLDAIQEFNLIENPKAEYGGKPGAIVNAGVRSGTNTLHGTAYAFGRDGSWDARNVFNPPPQPVQPVRLEQFGGSVGGPIKKDKLFYFANYEGARSFLGTPLPTTVPETASQVNNPVPGTCPPGQAGDCVSSMVDAIIALQNAGTPVSPLSQTLLGCPAGKLNTTSTCTGGFIQEPFAGANNNTTSYLSTLPLTNTSDNGIAKIDYRINDKNMINGTFYKGYYTGIGQDFPMVNSIWANTDIEQGWSLSGNWIYTLSSTLVNEFRVGYTRFGFSISPNDLNKVANGTDYPINTGTGAPGFPFIKIDNFGSELGGRDGRPSGTSPNPYLEFQDNVSYLRGKHAFKFGIEASRIEGDNFVNDQRGRIDFQGGQNSNAAFLCPAPNPTNASCSTDLEDFFAGLPSFAFQNVGSPNYRVTWHSLSGFAQDDWRITPKIMLNLGLRYSYYSPFHEVNNHLGNFDPNSPFGIVQQGEPSVGNTLWKPDRGNWSPRLGLAWDVTGKGTTVVRAGAGVFYSLYSLAWIADWSTPGASTSIAADPAGACTTSVNIGKPCPQTFGGTLVDGTAQIPGAKLTWSGPVFPTGLTLSCTTAAPCSIGAVDPHLKTPYMVDWNLGVEHSFTSNLSLDVSYVGNHGGHLLGIMDVNQAALGSVTQTNPFGVRPYSAKFPWLQYINEVVNDAFSNYNSLQATLTERLSHGLDVTVGYTYGHGLDNGSINRFGNPPQNSFDPRAEYANSDYDARHRATFTAGYELPGKKGFGQMLEGWKLNTIVTLQSGQPWTMIDSSNNFAGEGENDGRWDFFGNPSDFKVTSSSFPFCTGFPADFLSSGGSDLSGVSCSTQSGVSGITTPLPATMASACKVAPDITTLTAATGGCYVSRNGGSVIVPPLTNTYGTMGRGIFRDTGFRNVDFSIFKNFRFKERFNATFRVEFFNFFNHPILANPYSFSSGNDPSNSSGFGCGCATPDVAAGNSIVGSGAPRDLQLGFKLAF